MLIRKIDYGFLFLSVALAVAGMALGIVMGAREDFTLAPVHAHLNLVGFVTLALFGIAYRIGWAGKDVWALVHFAIAGAGAVALPAGIALAVLRHEPALVAAGSVLTLASMALFVVNCARACRTGDVGERSDADVALSSWNAFPRAARSHR
jgi:hypothetical protein